MSDLSPEEFQDIVMGERKFLHDVSNQLLVAQGMSSFLKKSFSKNPDMVGEKEVERLEKVIIAVKKIVEMVQERRERLHEVSDDKN
jgi:hypothetical protein